VCGEGLDTETAVHQWCCCDVESHATKRSSQNCNQSPRIWLSRSSLSSIMPCGICRILILPTWISSICPTPPPRAGSWKSDLCQYQCVLDTVQLRWLHCKYEYIKVHGQDEVHGYECLLEEALAWMGKWLLRSPQPAGQNKKHPRISPSKFQKKGSQMWRTPITRKFWILILGS
jgi:hypothetical protein